MGPEDEEMPSGFPALSESLKAGQTLDKTMLNEMRRVHVHAPRMGLLRDSWVELIQPLVEHMKLQVRMNTKRKAVELRRSPGCTDVNALQKGADYVRAFLLGFDLQDAI